MRFFGAIVLIGGCAATLGCAGGSEVAATFSPGMGGAGPGSSGQGGAGGEASTASTTASSTATATAAASSSATTGGGGMGGGSTTGSGPGCDYTAPNKCSGAAVIPAIDGDQNMDQRVAKGTTAKWFLVQVNEGSSSVVGHDLSFTATLDSPPGMDFDLWVYPGNGTMPDCNVAPKHAVGTPESFGDGWGDTLGSDDARVYTLEVRYASGMVCPAEQWTLTVKGHT